MPMQDTKERRAYYRIQDQIALQISNDGFDSLDDSLLFNLLNELQVLELESQPLLRAISEKQRTLVNYLKITNKRIDLLACAMAQNLQKEMGPPCEVSLSEGGLSFVHNQPCEPGASLYLKLLLLPQALGLTLQGRARYCQPIKNGLYRIAIEFDELGETQRQILARHILQKQAQERRQALADHEGE